MAVSFFDPSYSFLSAAFGVDGAGGDVRSPTYGRLRDGIARSAIGLCSRIRASGPEKDQDNSSLASRLGYHLTSVSLPFSPLREACLLSQSPPNEVTQLLHRWTNGDEK